MLRPVVYVMAGATIGMGLLAAAFGSDPSVVMADFVVEATGEIAPLIWRLLSVWAVFAALAALLSASAGELYLLSDADRARFGYTVLGKAHIRRVQYLANGTWLKRVIPIITNIWRCSWIAGVSPALVYE